MRPFHPHTNYCPRIISPNSLSNLCVGQKLSDILMSAPKNGPSHTAQHGAWQGLYKVMWNPQDISTLPKNFHTAIYMPIEFSLICCPDDCINVLHVFFTLSLQCWLFSVPCQTCNFLCLFCNCFPIVTTHSRKVQCDMLYNWCELSHKSTGCVNKNSTAISLSKPPIMDFINVLIFGNTYMCHKAFVCFAKFCFNMQYR